MTLIASLMLFFMDELSSAGRLNPAAIVYATSTSAIMCCFVILNESAACPRLVPAKRDEVRTAAWMQSFG